MANRSTRVPDNCSLPDFRRDIANPLFKEAEERVYVWLLAHGHHVEDRREDHTFYDFKVDSNRTLDVKCDTRARDTGNVTWELEVWHHAGRMQQGWGTHEGLHLVAYLLAPAHGREDTGKWPLVLCDAVRLRQFVSLHHDTPVCRYNVRHGTDRDGHNYILSLAALRRFGAIVQEDAA